MPYQILADAVLLLHFGVVLFVILGLPAIVIGNKIGWPWVNGFWWRATHLGTIAVVALQAWLDRYCPLTIVETRLRQKAGQPGYEGGFIEHWVQHLLYYDHGAPTWVFGLIYTGFGLLVVWAWWRYRPEMPTRKSRAPQHEH